MPGPQEDVERHLRQLAIICGAIFSGVVIFAGVVWFLLQGGGIAPSGAIPPIVGSALNLAGLFLLVLAYFAGRFPPVPGRAAAEDEVLAWHRKSTILGFALREGAAFLALVGALLTGRAAAGYAVTGLALLTMVVAWPRRAQLEARGRL